MKALYFTILILISTAFAFGQENSWLGLRPLHSTRADVEKLLGKPDRNFQFVAWYDKQGVGFFYLEKRCQYYWDVPEGTILNIKIAQENKDFGDLHHFYDTLLKKDFEEVSSLNTIRLIDPRKGIEFSFGNEWEYVIKSYIPRESDNYLRCDGFPPFTPTRQTCDPHNFFLSIYDSQNTDQSGFMELLYYLEEMLDSLRKTPKNRGFVMLYYDHQLPASRYRNIIKRAKNILIKKHRLRPGEITFVEAGFREKNEAQPCFVPEGLPLPVLNPTLPSPQFMRRPK